MLLETFTGLLRDPAHWQFELLVGFIEMLVFDVLVGAIVWPRIRAHIHQDVRRGVEQDKPADGLQSGAALGSYERIPCLYASLGRPDLDPARDLCRDCRLDKGEPR